MPPNLYYNRKSFTYNIYVYMYNYVIIASCELLPLTEGGTVCGGYLGLGRDYVDHILNPDTKLPILIVARLCREDTRTETGLYTTYYVPSM